MGLNLQVGRRRRRRPWVECRVSGGRQRENSRLPALLTHIFEEQKDTTRNCWWTRGERRGTLFRHVHLLGHA